jgi:imidazolonepropionase-like amidohydrolase
MGRLIFRRANLVDGAHPPRPATVLVEGERIAGVASGDGPAPAPGDRVIDLAGMTLMPGMVLGHFHAAYGYKGAGPAPLGLERPVSYMTLWAARHAHMALHCGFTGVVGGSTTADVDASLKAAIEDGLIEGPRFVASSRDLVTTADGTDTAPWWWKLGGEGAVRVCDGPDEFRKAVRDEIKRGADIIKLYPTGGHGLRTPAEAMAISREEICAAVEAAHGLGKRVRGHIVSRRAILACVAAGVDVIDHADQMDAECIDAFVRAGSFVAPSLLFPLRVLESAEARGEGAQPRWQKMRRDFEATCRMLPEASAAGVKLVLGDDYGSPQIAHGEYAKELEVYVRCAGISPLEVIRWATQNGAELMGRGDELGTVEEGKLADLLVVAGDPTADITVLQDPDNLRAILKGGAFVKDRLG